MVENETIAVPCYITCVACGFGIPFSDGIEYLDVPTIQLKGISKPLVIEVSGHSMEPFFYHRDLLLIDIEAEPRNKDIVLIHLNGSYYLKRLEFKEGKIILVSTNYFYPNIVLNDNDTWQVVGVYIRKLNNLVKTKIKQNQ